MIRVFQDFDENCRATWGLWFGTLSREGHVVAIAGPCLSEQACRAQLEHRDDIEASRSLATLEQERG